MKKYTRLFLLTCLLAYLFLLSYLLFFSQYRHSVEGFLTYNLVPFKTIVGYFSTLDGLSITDQFIGNVLAFVPFGFLLPLIVSRLGSFTFMLGSTFVFSLLVEITQLQLQVGVFDVDDLFLNTLGGVIGFLLSRLCNKKNRG
ncbi:MAG: VanZ family protein [Bacillota bacterium]